MIPLFEPDCKPSLETIRFSISKTQIEAERDASGEGVVVRPELNTNNGNSKTSGLCLVLELE